MPTHVKAKSTVDETPKIVWRSSHDKAFNKDIAETII